MEEKQEEEEEGKEGDKDDEEGHARPHVVQVTFNQMTQSESWF